MLRQPKSTPKHEKEAYVEEVIKMLNMGDFANAVVGVPGEGLNVEQRKLLTIGVELAAKPKLLLFLDEPTSGLDSQVSVIFLADIASIDIAAERMGYLCFLAKTRRCRSSCALHHPSTLSNLVPRI